MSRTRAQMERVVTVVLLAYAGYEVWLIGERRHTGERKQLAGADAAGDSGRSDQGPLEL